MGLSIIGFEIDGEEAFERQIEDWTQLFVEVLKDVWEFVKEHLGEIIEIIKEAAEENPIIQQ